MKINIPKDMNLPTVPPGWYEAAWTKSEMVQSQAGNPCLRAKLTIASQGSNPEINTIGRVVNTNFVLIEKSIWYVNGLHKAVTGNDLVADEEYSIEEFENYLTQTLMDKPVLIKLEANKDPKNARFPNVTEFKTIG